jgi:2-(1,2-epoxy-1,2-dihydrophenyl)acetyl-CoA isomerase
MTAYEAVPGLDVDVDDAGVLRIVLDRPAKRNALDDVMVAGLLGVVERAGQDEMVRAICLTGAGDHFCTGFDIVARNTGSDERRPRVGSIQRRLPAQAHRLVPLLTSVQTPIVAGARGWVAGIGLHLLLAGDFAVVADDARLWEPFSERGFTPDSGGTWLLPRRVGEMRAREMLLLGRAIDGREALDWGLATSALAADQVDAEALALARRLAQGPTVSLGLTKWLLHASSATGLEDHLRNEAFAMELSSRSEDFREGLTAFKEKRAPRFGGR